MPLDLEHMNKKKRDKRKSERRKKGCERVILCNCCQKWIRLEQGSIIFLASFLYEREVNLLSYRCLFVFVLDFT